MKSSRPWSSNKGFDSGKRSSQAANYSLYNSKRWRKVSKIERSKEPLCAACQALDLVVKADVRDHIIPVEHGGSFWDDRNRWSLCHDHHNSKSAREKVQPLFDYEGEHGDYLPKTDPRDLLTGRSMERLGGRGVKFLAIWPGNDPGLAPKKLGQK